MSFEQNNYLDFHFILNLGHPQWSILFHGDVRRFQERKNSLWKEITSVIHNDHPECTEKTQEQVEKSGKTLLLQQDLQLENSTTA